MMPSSRSVDLGWVLWVAGYLVFGGVAAAVCGIVWQTHGAEDPATIYALSFFLTASSVITVLGWWRLNGSLFDPFVLFFASMAAYNGGYAILTAFGLPWPFGLMDLLMRRQLLGAAFLLSTLGVYMLGLGALLASSKGRLVSHVMDAQAVDSPTARALRHIGWLFVLVAVVPAADLAMDDLLATLRGGYFEKYQGVKASGVAELFRFASLYLQPGCLLIIAGGRHHPRQRSIAMGIIVGYCLTYLFIGQRSEGSLGIAAALAVYHHAIRPLPVARLALIGCALLFVVFPTIKTIRNVEGKDRLNMGAYVEAFESVDNPVSTMMGNFGNAMAHAGWVQWMFPEVRDYEYGMTYLRATTFVVVPVQLWDRTIIERSSLARWMVWQVTPGFARSGGGWGFSAFAEAYVNFGWYGVVLVPLLFGYGFARFTRWGFASTNPTAMAVVGVSLLSFLLLARSEMIGMVRSLVWFSIIPYLMVWFFAKVTASREAFYRRMRAAVGRAS